MAFQHHETWLPLHKSRFLRRSEGRLCGSQGHYPT
jgi:hypothetical protein